MTAKIKLNATSGGGSVSIQGPSNTSNDRVFTLPDTADGTLLTSNSSVGKVVQFKSTTRTTIFSENVAEATFTAAAMSVDITPSSASNKILVRVIATVSAQTEQRYGIGIFKDGSILVQGDASGNRTRVTGQGHMTDGNQRATTIAAEFEDTAGGTSQITYDVRLLHAVGSSIDIYLNRTGLDYNSAGYFRSVSTISAMEMTP